MVKSWVSRVSGGGGDASLNGCWWFWPKGSTCKVADLDKSLYASTFVIGSLAEQ